MLLRSACSLASAGNVCWAKPNHAFFKCQQSFAKFFLAALASGASNTSTPTPPCMPCAHWTHGCAPSECRTCKRWRGLQQFQQAQASCCGRDCSACLVHACDVLRWRAWRCNSMPHFALHKRVCAKTARTFRACRASRTQLRHAAATLFPRIATRAEASKNPTLASSAQEKTRGVSVAGFGLHGAGDQWSSLSSNSAYSSGASSSLSCSASESSTTNSQPSP